MLDAILVSSKQQGCRASADPRPCPIAASAHAHARHALHARARTRTFGTHILAGTCRSGGDGKCACARPCAAYVRVCLGAHGRAAPTFPPGAPWTPGGPASLAGSLSSQPGGRTEWGLGCRRISGSVGPSLPCSGLCVYTRRPLSQEFPSFPLTSGKVCSSFKAHCGCYPLP